MSVMLDKLLKGQKVEWLKLGDVAKFVNGRAYKQPELLEQGKYPVLRVGNFFTNANWYYSDLELDADKYADNGDLLYAWSASFGPRIWQGDKVIYHYHIWKVIPNEQKILKKFLYHILEWDTNSLKNEYANGSTMMHITKGTIEQRLMPIPPLDVQAKIVKILDAFTALTAELSAELTMREKQYHYYRDKLLTFSDDEVEWKAFGEIAKIQRGASPRPIAQFITDDNEGIPWIKIGDTALNSKYINATAQKITKEGALKSRLLSKGDFIMSNSMSFGRPYILNLDGAIHDGWASISGFRDILFPDFLYHYLASGLVQKYWKSKINSSSVSNLNSDIIKTLPLPIPSMEEQIRIANLLDNFETYTNSITEGLPREIALRQQQYEYYREQLLDFPK